MSLQLIIIDGQNGAGKSTTAQLLHARLPRTALVAFDKIKRLLSDFAANEADHRLANDVVRAMTKEYLDHGINVIIESYIPTPEVAELYASLAAGGARLHCYELEASFATRMSRIEARPLAEGAKKKITPEKLELYDRGFVSNKLAGLRVITTEGRTPEEVVGEILGDLTA
jgi:predicted ABC-type ATPase